MLVPVRTVIIALTSGHLNGFPGQLGRCYACMVRGFGSQAHMGRAGMRICDLPSMYRHGNLIKA